MDDKTIMENILLTTKGVCDLYMHGAIESGTEKVNTAFKSALTDALCMQDSIYKQMTQKGWYTTENVSQDKIEKVKQKFTSVN